MFIKKLPNDVQSLLRASVKIKNYKSAIEELAYNSLDADSTSIAIRIHIKDNSIQVVDNGQGIKEVDMNSLGQRYMTSKFTSLSALKTTPENYGMHGESLTNIIEVSQFVSITSRFENTEDTWVQSFNKGKKQKLVKTIQRPSKGTTISIKGFLYNRNLQRSKVKEIDDLQEIKTFLEQLSLVHSNVSLSLRDDAKNTLIFQLHKKRDIYQTLLSIFNIEKSDVAELNVEKNKYKVKAYIGKTVKDVRKYWFFLNRKPVHTDSQLQIIVNDTFKRSTKSRNKTKIQKKHCSMENYVFDTNAPFYFIFIECPYQDYTVSKKNLDFKNWHQITKLLEKLVNFYVGDIYVKEVKSTKFEQKTVAHENANAKDKINDIMKKILGSNSKEGLQMRNGIKGKISNRKCKKKKLSRDDLSITKQRKSTITVKDLAKNENDQMLTHLNNKGTFLPITTLSNTNMNISQVKMPKNTISNELCEKEVKQNKNYYKVSKIDNIKKNKKTTKTKTMKINKAKHQNKFIFLENKIIKKFVSPTDSLKKRYGLLCQGTYNTLHYKNKHEKDHNDNVAKKFSNLKKSNKCFIHKAYYSPNSLCQDTEFIKRLCQFKSTYDLVKTVMNIDNENNYSNTVNKHPNNFKKNFISTENTKYTTQLTFQSHHYEKVETIKETSKFHHYQQTNIRNTGQSNKHPRIKIDLKKTSTSNNLQRNYNDKYKKRINFNIQNSMQRHLEKGSSYTIEYSNQNPYYEKHNYIEELYNETKHCNNDKSSNTEVMVSEIISTYNKEMDSAKKIVNEEVNTCYSDFLRHSENILESLHASKNNNKAEVEILNKDINPNSQSVLQYSNSEANTIEPLSICKAILSSEDIFENEISKSLIFNNDNFQDENENMSHYFTNSSNFVKTEDINKHLDTKVQEIKISSAKIDSIADPMQNNLSKDQSAHIDKNVIATDFNFIINNRPRFVPKGMSQIFKNCNTKNDCNYCFDEDHYEDSFYTNFANEIHINSEIFNPLIQNVGVNSETLNKRFHSNIDKGNAALKFNGQSLKCAKVLSQIDEKYIASIIKPNDIQTENITDFLVLFDQHAVDERIKTEHNLSDYIEHGNWKSVKQPEINIILSEEEIIYLHNYKDKFCELGLQYNIVGAEEISINAIPKAILGKNPRQMDKIIKAVRNLIFEEINAIKYQSGCISMYPKSIMNLIFSEACRNAIKFGDVLTKNDCLKLINELSHCNTPFQCAHGRPVMAVLMDLKRNKEEYKIDLIKVRKFKTKLHNY